MNATRTQRKLLNTLRGIGRFLILACFLVAVLAPIYWLFITSLKDQKDIATLNIQYWPSHVTFKNYIRLLQFSKFPVYMLNSVLISLASALVVLVISITGGYALARYKFKMKRVTIIGVLVSQMIPLTLVLVPMLLIFSGLGVYDSLFSLVVLYIIFNTPFCVITMQSFFMNVSASIEEAAMIDGCSRLQVLLRILMPIMLPAIIAVLIFAFIGAWNDLLGGVMLINSELKKTIPVGLSGYVGQFSINWGEMSAGGVIALIPSALLFVIAQKYIIAGLTEGGVKE
jgi:multiple sugar transport system permease protein